MRTSKIPSAVKIKCPVYFQFTECMVEIHSILIFAHQDRLLGLFIRTVKKREQEKEKRKTFRFAEMAKCDTVLESFAFQQIR